MTKHKRKRKRKPVQLRFIGERVSNGNKTFDSLVKFLFILGLISFIFEITLYHKTIIPLYVPLIICLTPGIVLTPILYKRMNDIDGLRAHWILHYILHSCITGALILYTFMATNYYFAQDKIITKSYGIIEKGSLPGSKYHRDQRQPYVIINYNGFRKELIFSYPETEKVDSSKTAILHVKHGLWGYDILKDYDVE